jgi:hypothetical protein
MTLRSSPLKETEKHVVCLIERQSERPDSYSSSEVTPYALPLAQ